MTNNDAGKIIECSHCNTYSGKYKNGMCHLGMKLCDNNEFESCPTCKTASNVPIEKSVYVVCSVCSGKKSIWIGPSVPEQIHEHKHEGGSNIFPDINPAIYGLISTIQNMNTFPDIRKEVQELNLVLQQLNSIIEKSLPHRD